MYFAFPGVGGSKTLQRKRRHPVYKSLVAQKVWPGIVSGKAEIKKRVKEDKERLTERENTRLN